MSPRNEDFLFAQEAQRRGYLTEAQVEEGLHLQQRMQDELQIEERLAVILVKRGWLAEEQARRVYARIEPDSDRDEIQGYSIESKIGHGAMGTVYKGVHLGLQRAVAIKVLRRDLARDSTQVERLKEEAKLLASLEHPNIVRAIDAGESRGFPFVVMEYVEGETLKERIARKGALPELEALEIARGIGDALERARRMGVVHRDVKPGNIILSRSGEPKLMDLGLAKGPVDLGLTQHGATVGTPQYISPEQAQDPRKADTRSDIYSLGATLYAMVTGGPPFHGTTLAEVLTKVLYEAPVPPRVANRAVSPEVSYLIERMMLKDPALRYRTPADVVRDIDDLISGRSIIPEGFTGNWEAFLLRKRIRKWAKVAVVSAAAVLVLGAAGFGLLRHRQHQAALEEGGRAVRAALEDTELNASDDELSVLQKLNDARAVRDRYADVRPEGWTRLDNHVWSLDRERRYFEDLRRIEGDVEALEKTSDYAQAYDKLRRFEEQIPGTTGPAEIAAATRREAVRLDSQERYEEIRTAMRGRPATTLSELLRNWKDYARQLEAGFILDDVRSARQEAARALDALGDVRASLGEMKRAFSARAQAERLDALRFKEIREHFETRRKAVLRTAERLWEPLAGPWLAWASLHDLIEPHLDDIEGGITSLFEARWEEVREKAESYKASGLADDALALLTNFSNAAGAANLYELKEAAQDLYEEIDLERRRLLERARLDYEAIEHDVLARLRAGDPAAGLGRTREALSGMSPRWPYRADVEGLQEIAKAYQELCSAAVRGLESRRDREVRSIQMRDGSERVDKWTVLGAAPGKPAAILVKLSRDGDPVRRELADIHPDQLAAWAAPVYGDAGLPWRLRVAALLAAEPETVPEDADLRPLVRYYRRLDTALRRAEFPTAHLNRRIGELAADLNYRQVDRESEVRTAIMAADSSIDRADFKRALFFLDKLFSPGNVKQQTDAFETNRDKLAVWHDRARKEVDNEPLVLRFPTWRIRIEGGKFETSVAADMEDPIQLEAFRRDPARAWGVIEQARALSRVVTPSPNNHRLHLIRGMEGLVYDRPLRLPCIFDPALPISVEFDLYTASSPFFLGVDVDGLQVGVLSADPLSGAYYERWRLPSDVPTLSPSEKPPRVNWYGRGRGVAFHAGTGFGDPRDLQTWSWPPEGYGRNHEVWEAGRRRRDVQKRLAHELFAFEPGKDYHVKVVREQGKLTLYVNGEFVAERERANWARIGKTSDRDRRMSRGSGLLQILTWTPMAIDNLRIQGTVLESFKEKGGR